MKRRTLLTALLLLLLTIIIGDIAAGGDLLACGDKFLVISRGTRFQRPSSRGPAAVLIYANASSQLPRALANVAIDATLQKAGYRSTTVASKEDLDRALVQGGWDLVVADAADAQGVASRLQGDGAPAVLPVVHNATSGQLKQLKDQFRCVLKAPAKNQSFLDAVDEALSLKPKLAASANKSIS
jgi:hypothetical protein